MEDLKGKVFGTTRFGTQSDLASRIALRKAGLELDRDVTMIQTGGPAETVMAMADGQGACGGDQSAGDAASETLQAQGADGFDHARCRVSRQRRGDDAALFEVQRGHRAALFARLYRRCGARYEGSCAFAIKTMGKYFRTDDKEVLDETYELSIKSGFTVPPYPAGISGVTARSRKNDA